MNNKKKIKIVIDTNVLLVSIPKKSEHRWLIDKIANDEVDLFITNDILMEYEEVLEKKANPVIKNLMIDFLLNADNVYKIFSYYNLNLITQDPDDNKFVDCAFASSADFIITHDKHYEILKNIQYPKIKTITINEFKKILE
jgi:uncharacterized protein